MNALLLLSLLRCYYYCYYGIINIITIHILLYLIIIINLRNYRNIDLATNRIGARGLHGLRRLILFSHYSEQRGFFHFII